MLFQESPAGQGKRDGARERGERERERERESREWAERREGP